MRTAAWCATAAVLAGSLGVYAGIQVGERDAARSPATAHLTPSTVEACRGSVTLTADVAAEEDEVLLVRLVHLDDHGREEVVRVDADGGSSLELGFAVPTTTATGRHLVRLERPDELLALGALSVEPCR